MPLKDSYHLSFKKGNEPLMVNCFHNGNIQMATVEVPKMIELIIPHLERKLKVYIVYRQLGCLAFSLEFWTKIE